MWKFSFFGLLLHNLQLKKPFHTCLKSERWNFASMYLVSLPPCDSRNRLMARSRIVSDGALYALSPLRHNETDNTTFLSFLSNSSSQCSCIFNSIASNNELCSILALGSNWYRKSGYNSSRLSKLSRTVRIGAFSLYKLDVTSSRSLNFAFNISTFLSRLTFNKIASRSALFSWHTNSRIATCLLNISMVELQQVTFLTFAFGPVRLPNLVAGSGILSLTINQCWSATLRNHKIFFWVLLGSDVMRNRSKSHQRGC